MPVKRGRSTTARGASSRARSAIIVNPQRLPRRPMYRGPRTSNVSLPGVYKFKRMTDQFFDFQTGTFNNAQITCGSASKLVKLIGFCFENLPNDTEFAALFKYYKIVGVKVKLVSSASVSDASLGTNLMADVITCYAPDDTAATVPSTTTLQQVRERQNAKLQVITANRRIVKRYIPYPRISEEVGDLAGSGNVIIGSQYKGWLPMANRRLIHNGLIIAIDNLLNNYDVRFKTEFTYYFKCKQVI